MMTAAQKLKCAEDDSAYQRSLNLGIAAKEAGQALVESHNKDFVETMRGVAVKLARENGTVTSDHLREYAIRHKLKPNHSNAWGSIFVGPEWESIGFTRSRLVTNHGRTIRIWSLRA